MRKIDSQLDGLQLSRRYSIPAPVEQETHSSSTRDSPAPGDESGDSNNSVRASQLQTAVKAFSTASTSRTLLEPHIILGYLRQGDLLDDVRANTDDRHNSHSTDNDHDLEWLLVSKATNQTYGLVLRLLLDQTIPLSDDIEYWTDVLGSYRYTALYSIQTSPLRLWSLAKEVYQDASQRLLSIQDEGEEAADITNSVSGRWRTFYGLVKDSVRDRSVTDIQSKFMSSITISQVEVRSKRRRLRRLREMSGSGIGILVDEGMVLDADDEDSVTSKARSDDRDEWKSVVAKSVSLMESVLRNIVSPEINLGDFEESVFVRIDEEVEGIQGDEGNGANNAQTAQIAVRLQQLLEVHIPFYNEALRQASATYGRPSRLTRYWLPGAILLFSSGTLLRFFFNRKAAIITWIRDSRDTVKDFWVNWVVEPVKKIIGTIRHDKDSEIAIMSRDSLKGDQASLERMVTDFAIDNPESGSPLTEAQIADIRTKVREGDLTPVLMAYERDLRRPFLGTIRGELIRAMLIQIQKTKVDVEVAIGGIDNLLKSQELVFGFVGLTPSVLICIGAYRWLSESITGRQGQSQGRKRGSLLRILRNIDRVLAASTPASSGMLTYKHHGMLLCEVHVLQQQAATLLPRNVYNELREDIQELIDLRSGIERQLRVVERIRWAYSRYFC